MGYGKFFRVVQLTKNYSLTEYSAEYKIVTDLLCDCKYIKLQVPLH